AARARVLRTGAAVERRRPAALRGRRHRRGRLSRLHAPRPPGGGAASPGKAAQCAAFSVSASWMRRRWPGGGGAGRAYHVAMKARLIATGERAPSWVAEGFAEYRKRLSHWMPLELVEVEPGLRGKGRDPQRAIEDEGRRVLAALPKSAHVIALDVPGRPWSSEQLAARMEHWRQQGRDL